MSTIAEVEREYLQQQGMFQQLEKLQAEHEGTLGDLKSVLSVSRAAHELLQQMADRERDVLQRKVESLVTYGVQAVFGPEYEFRLVQTISRGLVNYEFQLLHLGHATSLKDAHGGGVLAVVGYLLRLVVLLLSGKRRLLLLDETFAHVSRAHLASVAALLRHVTDSLGVQHIMVTHSPELEESADAVYRVKLDAEGHSQVIRMTEWTDDVRVIGGGSGGEAEEEH